MPSAAKSLQGKPVPDLIAADFAMVRSPLLPFQELASLSTGLGEPSGGGLWTDHRVASVIAKLQTRCAHPEVQEAILVASPSLHARMQTWKDEVDQAKALKTARAVMKYFSRMAYRCTPFGLLAGVSWLALDSAANGPVGVQISARHAYQRRSRLDMGVVGRMKERLLAEPSVRHSTSYFWNPTLHRRGSSWQYIEATKVAQLTRFTMSSVDSSPHLECLLRELRPSEFATFAQLVDLVCRTVGDTSAEDAQEFLDELIRHGLLLSALEPPLTGGNPISHVLAAIRECSDVRYASHLEELSERFASLDQIPLGSGAAAFSAAMSAVSEGLLVHGDEPVRNVIQTDMYKPVSNVQIPQELIGEIGVTVAALASFPSPSSPLLDDFKRTFVERYGDAEIPLMDALDPDLGIPFGKGGTDDLPLTDVPMPARRRDSLRQPESPWTDILVREFERACRNGLAEITLTDEMLSAAQEASKPATLPPSLYAVVTVLPADETSRLRVLVKGIGHPGPILFGRFCADEADTARLRRFLRREEQLDPQLIHAEVIHWPVDRYGNVLLRPQLRDHEIPIYGRSSVPADRQILLRNILVSVQHEQIVLRCALSGRRISPCLTSAHNTNLKSIPVYRFLGALRRQEGVLVGFHWPADLSLARRLPRLSYRNCILAPETWRLGATDLASVTDKRGAAARGRIEDLRTELGWPRFIELVNGDNCLCIDLDNPISVDCMLDELQDQSAIVLREAFVPNPSAGFVRGPEGTFCHELILPFSPQSHTPPPPLRKHWKRARRSAALVPTPSDAWLYLKLYAGTCGAEKLLSENLPAFLDELRRNNLLDKWFFLRYRDSEEHLRLRILPLPSREWSTDHTFVRNFIQGLWKDEIVHKVSIDRYEPEVERYGGPGAFPISERIFHADSEFALQMIRAGYLADPLKRWKYVLAVVDTIWRVGGYSESERAALYANHAQRNRSAHERSKSAKVIIDKKFRAHRAELADFVFGGSAAAPAGPVIARYVERLLPLMSLLKAELATAQRSSEEVITSLVHMSVNRLCLAKGAAQEYVIYELLARLFAQFRARTGEPIWGSTTEALKV